MLTIIYTMRYGDTIIHVELPELYLENHHYFGSVTAIFDKFTKEDLGVGKETICRHLKREGFYLTPTGVMIRKSTVHRKGRK